MKTGKKLFASFLVVVMVLCSAPLQGFVGLELPSFDWFKTTASAAEASSGTDENGFSWTSDGINATITEYNPSKGNSLFYGIEYNGHYYGLSVSIKTWNDAKLDCEANGGHLVTITDAEEQKTVQKLLSYDTSATAWIGASDEDTEGEWTWCTGEEFNYTNWYFREPNNLNEEDYAGIYLNDHNFKWNDWGSSQTFRYICEWDELPSKEIFSEYKFYGLEYNGHYYGLSQNKLTWEEARVSCEEVGGQLISINNESEQDLVERLLGFAPSGNRWIGAHKVDGLWQWVDGEVLEYNNWGLGEPNGNANTAQIYYSSFKWDGTPGTMYYICEWNTQPSEDYFKFCLTDIVIPEKINDLPVTAIGNSAFQNKRTISTVIIPDTVKSIGDYAFSGCNSVVGIEMPTELKTIGSYAFSGCNQLTNIEISNSVTSIRYGAFEGCSSLTSITVLNPSVIIEDKAFGYYDDKINDNVTIYGFENSTAQTYAKINGIKFVSIGGEVPGGTSEDKSTVQIGADRFSFGKDVTGKIGETIDLLVLYNSEKFNINALSFTSDNTSVAEIVEVKRNKGEYITQENEHIATISLKLKSAGKAKITVNAPNKVSVSITLDVGNTATKEDTFLKSEYIYMAQIILNHNYLGAATLKGNTTLPKIRLDRFMDPSICSISRPTVADLNSSGAFVASVAGWRIATFNLSDVLKYSKEEIGYYQAIIMNILNASVEYSLLPSAMKSYTKNVNSICKNIAEYKIDCIDKVSSANLWDIKNFSPEDARDIYFALDKERNKINGRLSRYNDTSMVFKAGASALDIVNRFASDAAIADLSENIKEVIDEMYRNCPASNVVLKAALLEIKTVANSKIDRICLDILHAGGVFGSEALEKALDELWEGALEAIVGDLASSVFIGQAIGKAVSNMLFSTDKIIEQWYKLNALVEVENVVYSTIRSLSSKFKSDSSESNASVLLSAIQILGNTYNEDYEMSEELIEYAYEKGIANRISTGVFKMVNKGKKTEAEMYHECVKTMKNNIKDLYEITDPNFYAKWLKMDKIIYDESLTADEKTKKLMSVHCPTDVQVYDKDNNLLVSIVNNEIEHLAFGIYVNIQDSQKDIYLSDDDEYKVVITGTDKGTMNYEISEIVDKIITRTVSYNAVPLTDGITYTANFNMNKEINSKYYDLHCKDGKVISATYDTLKCNHIDSDSNGICDNCGLYIEEIKHSFTEWKIFKNPTCTEIGLKVIICSTCKAEGEKREVIPAKGHTDNNSDGYCDTCGADINPVLHCTCNCHSSGIKKFFFNFILFFQKIFKANRVCSCGNYHY